MTWGLGSVVWMAVVRKVLKFSDLTDLGDIDPIFKGVKMEKGDVEKEKYLNVNIPECDSSFWKEVEELKVGDLKFVKPEEKIVVIPPWWVILAREEKVKFLKHPEYILLRNYIDSGGDEKELEWCSFQHIVQKIKYPEKRVADKAVFKAAVKKWKILRLDYDFGRFFESRDTVCLAKKMIELDILDK